MKRLLVMVLVLAPVSAFAEKYAFVDLQRALFETEEGKRVRNRLKSDFDRKQKELDDKQEELKKMKESLDKKKQMMKPEAYAKEEKDFQDRFIELQNTFARLQRDLATKEQDATGGIMTKLQSVVGKIAEREHFAMVFERNTAVVWALPSLDITNEVIRTYNAMPASDSGDKGKAGAKK